MYADALTEQQTTLDDYPEELLLPELPDELLPELPEDELDDFPELGDLLEGAIGLGQESLWIWTSLIKSIRFTPQGNQIDQRDIGVRPVATCSRAGIYTDMF